MIYSQVPVRKFCAFGHNDLPQEAEFLSMLETLTEGNSLKKITSVDDLLLTDDLRTKAGYRYTFNAFSRLCTILAPNLSGLLGNLQADEGRDIGIDRKFRIFSDQFAADILNRLIRFRFDLLAGKFQLLVNVENKSISRIVGFRYNADEFKNIYEDCRNSLTALVPGARFAAAMFSSTAHTFSFYNPADCLEVRDRAMHPIYSYSFHTEKSLAFEGNCGLLDATTGNRMLGIKSAKFMLTRTRRPQARVLMDKLNQTLVFSPQVDLQKLIGDFDQLAETPVRFGTTIDNPTKAVAYVAELVHRIIRDEKFCAKVARSYVHKYWDVSSIETDYLALWLTIMDAIGSTNRSDSFYEIGLYKFLITPKGSDHGQASKLSRKLTEKERLREYSREGKFETRGEKDRKTRTRDEA